MTVGVTPLPAEVSDEGPESSPPLWSRAVVTDILSVAGYWVAACWVLIRLWADPTGNAVRPNGQDQVFFEWLLAHGARVTTHGENPLFSARMNAPDGVNMMANTSALGITIPLTPLTVTAGPAVSYAFWCTAALALTATAWYFFLSRYVVSSRIAAFVGGAFCGFAPGLVAHLHGQPNISSQFVVPLILWQVLRLREENRVRRGGLILGLLITYQAFVNEELLFFTAFACGVIAVTYACLHWPDARAVAGRVAAGLGVAILVAGVLLAYPLWYQFAGPQSYASLPHQFQDHVADLGGFPAFATESLSGRLEGGKFTLTSVEENTFYGWPLLALVTVAVIWFHRDLRIRLAAVVAVVFGVLAMGSELTHNRQPTGIPGPWRLLASVPPFDMVVPTRLALVTTAAIGVILAVSVDRFSQSPATALGSRPTRTALWLAAVAAVCVPLLPTRLETGPRQPTPKFLTTGAWRSYVGPGETVVPLPMPIGRETRLDGMTWSAQSLLAFRIPHGYFLGPDPGNGGRARFGAPTSTFGSYIAYTNDKFTAIPMTPELRESLIADLRRWDAAILVLPRNYSRAGVIRTAVEQFAGPARAVGDVWLWDVRYLA